MCVLAPIATMVLGIVVQYGSLLGVAVVVGGRMNLFVV